MTDRCVAKFEIVSRKQFEKDFEFSLFTFSNAVAGNLLTNLEIRDWCYDHTVLPVRKTIGSAGYDFISPCTRYIGSKSETLFATGIKCKIEDGYVLKFYPRSSLGFKYRLQLVDTIPVIDSDYYNNSNNEGHILIKMYNPSDDLIIIREGEAYAQGIFEKFYLAEEDEVTNKRIGGFGSTNH